MAISADVRHLFWGFAGIVLITLLLWWRPNLSNATTVALGYLIVVLLVAATSRLWVAVTTSIAAMLAFNFFFLPPVGAFVIADPHNWIALIAFLVVSLVASNLSAVARDRTGVAETRRDELARLLDLSRDVLLITDSQEAHARLAGFIARRFDLDYAAICVPLESEWAVFRAGPREMTLDPRELSLAFHSPQTERRFTADGVSLIPLRLGTKPIGMVAAAGRPLEPGTFDAVAGIAAIALERAQFLDERKGAELARQSEEFKSALLASLGHDLRTPLTAIRVAASNLAGVVAERAGAPGAERHHPGRSGSVDAPVPEHSGNGPHRRRCHRGGHAVGGAIGDRRRRAQPRGAHAAGKEPADLG